ncbi:ABC transporter permease [Paraferrimonas sedimenticola]|uniref:Transporter n=1 Tax=Paraferrimonas sedimenticola TaxID=375674 RepID=A0AA37RV30_9GAMM|nr:ABC transporter permease [Paraferrimonas sedimenticola]GLP95429.1 transporter [Paraferrimonas sedimenticola]
MSAIMTILKKELLDAFRDKRSVMAGLYYSIGTPVIISLLFMVLIGKVTSPDTLYLDIQHGERAPDLVRYLTSNGIEHGEEEQRKAITLRIGENYASQLSEGLEADVYLEADFSNNELQQSITRLRRAVQAYAGEIGSLRLVTRGVDPRVIKVIALHEQDSSAAKARGGFILGMAIFIMIYSVFISGMNLAIDTSAGERERDSLGLLLSQPITPMSIAWAKVICVTVFAMIGLALTLICSKIAYTFVPWEELGFNVNIDQTLVSAMLIVGFPIALMAASMQLFVSFMAKTFKEAQSYLTMVLFVPLALAMTANYEIAPHVLKWLPVSGQQQALMTLVKGQALPMQELLVSSSLTTAIAIGLTLAIDRLLKSEKVVFGL